ncbi:geranylgeranyl transferase type-2 subunit alpha [Procambarus clarkii]|uniref:geranylgeranyl transferase type-2 subunit alpha n=1 Tax=Procambarus clarkii TaxID=6728 RepID=UPI001E6710E0|nr:geranylgeranyl transferase type-2 subunit alpha-like [Procambarus clarkii]
MHGRLKIKTTAEQAAEKQKERAEKKKLYLAGLTKAFAKRKSGIHDEEGLKITAQLVAANPDAATLWNFRREILLAMKGDDQELWEKLLKGEMTLVENCLMKNHKSYGAWHHRCWVMENFPSPPWAAEIALCDKYLKADERNFHCWDYRRFVVAGSDQQPEDELKVSQHLIEHNLSNYSAWHYRSKLLPQVYPPPPNTPHPISENALIKELKTVVEAVFTDPSDQSPWFFLQWLVNRQEKTPRMLQVGYVRNKGDTGQLICVFSQPVPRTEVPLVRVDGSESDENLLWYSPICEQFSSVWVAKLQLSLEEAHTVIMNISSSMKKSISVDVGPTQAIEWVTALEACGEELSDTTRSTLEEVKENCVTLDELDPGNKWVLLTLVDVMWALDSHTHQKKIHSYLSQLQELDPLRSKYYLDMKSKLTMETALQHHRIVAEIGSKFQLSNSHLTRITLSHLLASTISVDLSCNDLISISPLQNLVACRILNLDNNQIQNLAPLASLTNLETLSVANNKIDNLDQLKVLKGLPNLIELNVSSNRICDLENVDEDIREVLPQIQSLILR